MSIYALLPFLAVLLIPSHLWAAAAVAVSTAAASVGPSTWSQVNAALDKVIAIMQSPILGKIVIILAGLLGGGKWFKNQAIQKWSQLAFHTVEEIARTNPGNEKLDKAAKFAEVFEGYMKRAGWLYITDGDHEQAQAIAKGVNVLYTQGQSFAKSNGGVPPAQ